MSRLDRDFIAKKIFRPILLRELGLPGNDSDTVRFPYGTKPSVGSAPGPDSRMRDYCYIYISPGADRYGEQHHISAQDTDSASDMLTYVDQYTEIHNILFTFYGPNSDSWSSIVRNALLRRDISGALKQKCLFLQVPISPIRETRDLVNGEWWTRHDLSTVYFEAACHEIPNSVPTIETFNIQAIPDKSK